MRLRAPIPGPLGWLPKHASYWLYVLLFRKPLHELLSLQGDTFLQFYPVSLMYCSAMQSRCASRGTCASKTSERAPDATVAESLVARSREPAARFEPAW